MSIISTFQSAPLGDVSASADMKQAGVNPAAHALSHDINLHYPRYLHLYELLSFLAIEPQQPQIPKSRSPTYHSSAPLINPSIPLQLPPLPTCCLPQAPTPLPRALRFPSSKPAGAAMTVAAAVSRFLAQSCEKHVSNHTPHDTAHSTQHTQSCKTELRAPEHFEHGIRE